MNNVRKPTIRFIILVVISPEKLLKREREREKKKTLNNIYLRIFYWGLRL